MGILVDFVDVGFEMIGCGRDIDVAAEEIQQFIDAFFMQRRTGKNRIAVSKKYCFIICPSVICYNTSREQLRSWKVSWILFGNAGMILQ